jgi:hypothetical protein
MLATAKEILQFSKQIKERAHHLPIAHYLLPYHHTEPAETYHHTEPVEMPIYYYQTHEIPYIRHIPI